MTVVEPMIKIANTERDQLEFDYRIFNNHNPTINHI